MAANGKFQDYCLKWNNYHQHLSSAFLQLLENESMVDVTLSAGGERIRAHKIVLSACSPYFQDILATAEDTHPTVIFSDVNPDDLKSVLEFIYRGELCVMASRFSSVLKFANDLKIRGLSEVSYCLPGLEEVSGIEQLVDGAPNDECVKGKSPVRDPSAIHSDKSIPGSPIPEVDAMEGVEAVKAMAEGKASKDDADSVSRVCGQEMEICRGEEVRTETDGRDGGELAEDHGLLIIKGGGEEKNEADNTNELGQKISVHGMKSSIRAFPRYVKRCEGLVQITTRKKNHKQRYRKEYSEESLSEALDELRRGRPLLETAAAHHIPRSTLYVRARGLGIQLPLTRQEYPGEMMSAAIQAVQSGTSLKRAADHFKIPKTVLWRKVRRELENGTIQYHRKADKIVRCPPYTAEQRQAAIDALVRGESISKVFREYQIPKTTLFRERSRLIACGRIPSSSHRRDDGTRRGNLIQEQLDLAVAACLKRGMTHALAAVTYQVPKTTLWRRLQQLRKKNGEECGQGQGDGEAIVIGEASVEEGKEMEGEESNLKIEKVYSSTKEAHDNLGMDSGTLEMVVENEVTVKEGEEGSVVSFVGADGTTNCTEALQLPPGSSLIILTTGEGIELQEGEQIIVETDETGKEILNADE
ncbi:uncharacterized protein LOC124155437 isoform X2 [Ischnura elegans]|nr:uncharacterized protein LOC124155437 isoform X2 [Ischnura elegans]XP_046385209.1 uncharacterized protein LOC124155437 isoform X2 [Ischnura elegans]